MIRIINAIILAEGLPRVAIALLAGAVSALAMPPYDAFFVLWLTLPVLVWLLDGATPSARRWRWWPGPSFMTGWLFGFGYFVAGLWWIGKAFMVDAGTYGWMLPFAMTLLPAGLALFHGLAAALARRFWADGWVRVVMLAVFFSLAEWLRATILTGFPWNGFGYALTTNDLMMQAASLTGLHGLTLLALLIFAAPAALLPAPRRRTGSVIFAVFAALLFVGLPGFGAARLHQAETGTVDNVALRIVQPAIPQTDKWVRDNRQRIFNTYLELSDSRTSPEHVGMLSVTHLIWPESAPPFLLTEDAAALAAIRELLPIGSTLITGAIRADPASAGDARRVFNSVYAINAEGEIISAYDKVHLVPFGEYVPLSWLGTKLGLSPLVGRGFTAGTQRSLLKAGTAPAFAPLVCYEAIFPGEVVDRAQRPGWLLNVTNDAWYGDSAGPYQHLRQARLRAVEEGLPLVRAANTGISGVYDAYGRKQAELGLGIVGVVDALLPVAIAPTLYVRYGQGPYFALLIVILFTAIYARFTATRKSD